MLALHSKHHALLAHVAGLRQPRLGGEPAGWTRENAQRGQGGDASPPSHRETRKTGSTPDTRAPSQVEGRDIQGPCFPQAFRFLGHKVFIAKAGVVTDASSLAGKLAKAIKITSAPMEQFQSQEFIQQILPRVSNDVLTRVLTAACLWQKRLETSYVVWIGVPVTDCIPYGPHTKLSTKQSESKVRKLFLCKQGMISKLYCQ